MDPTYNLNGGFKPTVKRFADLDGPDFFPTPRWATYALIENESFEGAIWEPACGNGEMAHVLEKTGCQIEATDLYARGYGKGGVDFLRTQRLVDNIVTNPPYHAAEGFVHAGLLQARRKLGLLLRLAFLEGGKRQRTIFTATPPTRVWVFSERITFYPAGMIRQGGGTTAYAWFVWDKTADKSFTELKWLPAGYKTKFSKSEGSDAEKPILLR